MANTVILGLSFNTRMLGLAVITENDLVDYHIQLRKESWTPHKRELILTSLQPWFERYSIKNIALSIPYEKQTSQQTQQLIDSLTRHCKEKNLRLATYDPQALRSFHREAQTKKEIMKMLAMKYPDLLFHYHKEMNNKNKYYVKLFEAAGVATIHLEKLKNRRRIIETGL